MSGYYTKKLSAERLKLCYDLATLAVKRYLETEIDFVREKIKPKTYVLELGCGYGRALKELVSSGVKLFGIDTSLESLLMGYEYLRCIKNIHLFQMDAVTLGFRSQTFDLVICIQNGISAFKVNQKRLFKEAIRVTKSGGKILFSSYSEIFWKHRLEWFHIQAANELVGEIDEEKTRNGVIICKDGFKATTSGANDFIQLANSVNNQVKITEVGESSIFCEMEK